MCVTPVGYFSEWPEGAGKRFNVRRAPVQQNPHYHGLFWVVAYMWTETVKNTTKVAIGTQNNVRGCHEWLDREEDVRN